MRNFHDRKVYERVTLKVECIDMEFLCSDGGEDVGLNRSSNVGEAQSGHINGNVWAVENIINGSACGQLFEGKVLFVPRGHVALPTVVWTGSGAWEYEQRPRFASRSWRKMKLGGLGKTRETEQ